jgi:RNA polymerase sigma-70 factor (ECF subfamily)
LTTSVEQSEHFESLLSDNRGRLMRIARTYASDEEVEDLLQEIHLQLWRSRCSFTGASHVNTWLYRVALNTAISFARRRKQAIVSLDQPERLPAAADVSDSLHLLREFLHSLNDVNRSVLLMYLDGVSHKEIGEVLGSRPNAVAVRLNRIKQDFEQRYVEDVT